MNSFKKSSEDKFPKKSKFFSSLKDEDSSEKDYEKAKNIWNTFDFWYKNIRRISQPLSKGRCLIIG